MHLQWQREYKDEVFSGENVVPGIALQFIYMLRLLGGTQNPLVNKLYNTSNDEERQALLEKIMPVLMPGDVFPEAKIVGELNLNQSFISIESNTTAKSKMTILSNMQYQALSASIEAQNEVQLQALLKSGYSPSAGGVRCCLLSEVITHVNDSALKKRMMQLLIQHGANIDVHDRSEQEKGVLANAIKKGSAQDLDFLLSQTYPLLDEPMIIRLANPNPRFSMSQHIDLVQLACDYDFTGSKLGVFKKHGVDFHANDIAYIKTAIQASGGDIGRNQVNVKALRFLANEGISIKDKKAHNETPLMLAVEQNNLPLVDFLINQLQADVNAPLCFSRYSFICGKTFYDDESNGRTALHIAAQRGFTDLVDYLLEKNADPSLKTVTGIIPADLVPNDMPDLKAKLSQIELDHHIAFEQEKPKTKKLKLAHTSQMRHQKVATLLTGIQSNGERYIILGRPRGNEDDPKNYFCFPGEPLILMMKICKQPPYVNCLKKQALMLAKCPT